MKKLLSIFLICIGLSAHAMKIEVHKNMVFASGVVGDDVIAFQEAFAKPGVDTVVLVNSPGGDLWTGLRVGRMIADKGLKTVAAGACVSSCSIMFMGGKERTFSDAFSAPVTFIGIHGAHNKYTKTVDSNIQPGIFAFLKQNMGENFSADIMNTALFDMEDAGSLLRIFDAFREPKRVTYHCKSAQTLRKDCTNFKDANALKLGVVTSDVLTKIELPESFRYKSLLFGKDLSDIINEPDNYYKNLISKQCIVDTCKKLFSNHENSKSEHKALAIPINGTGAGVVSGRVSETQAFIGAVYFCNHVKDKPARLCETQSVNQFDVRDVYTKADQSHVEALAKLSSPTENHFANEEYGGGLTSFTAYKYQKWKDITPQKLEGVRTYSTKDLAIDMKGDKPPVVINVLGGVIESLPGALTLTNGGMALEDAEKDREFEARFAALLKLLSPDSHRPIVFYCHGRDSWFSVNAAMRAKKLGYTNVGWYRGGFESWKSAKLPMGSVVVRAVAN